MRQLLLKKSKVRVEEVPEPAKKSHNLIVQVHHSLISTGTESSSVNASSKSLVTKVLNKPAAITKAIQSIKVRGVKKTFALANDQLEQAVALGYSCCGTVVVTGDCTNGFQVGDRVACAGAGYANHAEVVSVPANLCVKIPDGVTTRASSFMTLGGIALQGVRRADVRIGENVCVIGLGLIGQLTAQLLVASGCKVFGVDLDSSRVEQAKKFGMHWGADSMTKLSKLIDTNLGGRGVDATIITAATPSSEPTRQAFHLTRQKGKIVVVGAVGMDLERSPFYQKEQDFLISCSYGPGRYDPEYEEKGQDYPFGYVRWTENRNMAAFLDLIAQGKIDVESLIEQEVSLADVSKFYDSISEESGKKPLAVVIKYPIDLSVGSAKVQSPVSVKLVEQTEAIRLGLVGVGSFAKAIHVPNIEKQSENLVIAGVCTSSGASASTTGRQLKVDFITNDYQEIIDSPNVHAVLVATRHDNHAEIAKAALLAGKHIYLEKPMALTIEELDDLDDTIQKLPKQPVFLVGFNRRYSEAAIYIFKRMKERVGPAMIDYRVNAGTLPSGHWIHGEEGGGRLRGEACHMIDLFRFLIDSPLVECDIEAIKTRDSSVRADENFQARFHYADGSVCSLLYTSQGNPALGKERVECHWDSSSAVIDDFKSFRMLNNSGNEVSKSSDKGHATALDAFVMAIKDGIPFPIPWEQLHETTQAAIELDREIRGQISI